MRNDPHRALTADQLSTRRLRDAALQRLRNNCHSRSGCMVTSSPNFSLKQRARLTTVTLAQGAPRKATRGRRDDQDVTSLTTPSRRGCFDERGSTSSWSVSSGAAATAVTGTVRIAKPALIGVSPTFLRDASRSVARVHSAPSNRSCRVLPTLRSNRGRPQQ